MQRRLTTLTLAALLWPLLTGAADYKHVKYEPPEGFAGHKWGEPRAHFERLPSKPFAGGAAWMPPIVVDTRIDCIDPLCNVTQVLQSIVERSEGGGLYTMTEYEIDGQGFQWGSDSRLQFYPVDYQFCANWWSKKNDKPKNFDDINVFCGIRLTFQSETRAQLERLPGDHVTTYDLVLDKLLEKFGRPDGFVRRGQVFVETSEAKESTGRPERKFRTYRWCPAFDPGLRTPCKASVVLTVDLDTGTGTLLYSTPLLWEYAYARQNFGYKGEPLFKVLHARK